jgi:hypothetical protein
VKIQLIMPDAVFEEFMHSFHEFASRHRSAVFEMYCGSDEEDGTGMSSDEAMRILQSLGDDLLVEKLTKQ